jgi:hypothetical protein
MKSSTLLCFALTLISASLTHAEQTLGYPEEKPLITFDVPDDWEVKSQTQGGSLFVVSPDGGDVILEVMTMEAGLDDDEAAFAEAKGTVEEDFKNLELTPSDVVEAKGLMMRLVGGGGEDKSGEAHINMVLIKHPAAETQILFSIIASKENAAKHGAACGAMMESIAAVKAKPKAMAGGKLQSFAYPDKDKPDFMVDYPADWVTKTTDEGAYVESPDKLVSLNLLMVPKDEVEIAQEALKKSIGERFKEIVWNEGNDPEVNKDADLGLTATFNNAQASDGDGTEKYSVNLISYVRKSGDKSLILLIQKPLRALEKHADAMESIIKSVKVR